MLKPVCAECNLEMRSLKNGVDVVIMAFRPPQPYKAYSTDKFSCPLCGYAVYYAGTTTQPFWQDFSNRDAPDLDNESVIPVWEYIRDAEKAKKTKGATNAGESTRS